MPSIRANVRPEVLHWARRTAGLSVEDSARRIGGQRFKPERIAAWEAGEDQPTVAQLRKIAEVYKRPLAVFFLSEPPSGFTAPRDFRRLPGDGLRYLSPELTLQLRRAQERREIASELYEEMDEPFPVFSLGLTLQSDPEAAGSEIRQALGVTMAEQVTWRERQRYKPLREWRRRIEEAGVLVFQFTDVDPAEALGFSIADGSVPVIAVNRKLTPNGRIFSLLHELVHVALRVSGICDIEESLHRPPEEQRIEVFCNRTAAAALICAEDLFATHLVSSHSGATWDDAEITSLADLFSVSREVIVRRLLTLGRTTQQFYVEKRAQYAAQRESASAASAGAEERSGFESPVTRAVSTQGAGYVRLVLESYHQGRITLSDVSTYLGVRTKHLSRIERAVLAA
jgi:Zn-dependent peptidase ImmA (M78 family)